MIHIMVVLLAALLVGAFIHAVISRRRTNQKLNEIGTELKSTKTLLSKTQKAQKTLKNQVETHQNGFEKRLQDCLKIGTELESTKRLLTKSMEGQKHLKSQVDTLTRHRSEFEKRLQEVENVIDDWETDSSASSETDSSSSAGS